MKRCIRGKGVAALLLTGMVLLFTACGAPASTADSASADTAASAPAGTANEASTPAIPEQATPAEGTPVAELSSSRDARSPSPQGDIGLDKAREIALNHAGLTADKATFIKEKMDTDHGRRIYEIEFVAGDQKYEFDIAAGDGEILEYSQKTVASAGSIGEIGIGLERAKEIALEHAGLTAEQVTFIKTELDYDDGDAEYEIEFITGDKEYEYTVHAATGTILEADVERFDGHH